MTTATDAAARIIDASRPYIAVITIVGSADILFHRWNTEAVAEKAAAAKGSKAKKTDDVESYVYRMANGNIAIPGEYLRMSLLEAAKFRQDPRSPRKSAKDLFKAGLVSLTDLADTGKPTWDYIHACRVTVQQAAVTRQRPALHAGWEATFQLQVLTPEYIGRDLLGSVLSDAGRLVGLADFRPTYGRFQIARFTIETLGE